IAGRLPGESVAALPRIPHRVARTALRGHQRALHFVDGIYFDVLLAIDFLGDHEVRRGNQDGSAASIRMRELRRARDEGTA
ncbi:hypothetical protein, partial [Bradyrhizobium canariense]|uniref:hypothetical protein n=1 Tax=Bradyrhizobium canariense TaxID=255045 RepID=UPI001CA5DB29